MAALTSAPLLLFFTCSWISVLCEDTQNVTAESGKDVHLQCRGPRGADITVKWSRPDLKPDDGFVFFFRDGRSYESYQHPSFRGRVELRDPEMKDGDVSVVLKNVTVNDCGTYECRVSAASGGGTMALSKLTVTDSGLTAGHNQGGGTEEEGNNDGVTKDGNVGLRVVLPVVLVLVALVAGGVVGFLIFGNHRRRRENNSNQRPDGEEAQQLQP